MRSKNSRPIDADESAWLADVKSCACVFCDAPPPVEAHHPKQGLHFGVIAACKNCHDARVWRIGGMTELEAANETVRRVLALRAGKRLYSKATRPQSKGSALTSSKILPRAAA